MRIYLVTANAQDHNEYIEYRDQPYNPNSFTDPPMHMGETSYTAGFVSHFQWREDFTQSKPLGAVSTNWNAPELAEYALPRMNNTLLLHGHTHAHDPLEFGRHHNEINVGLDAWCFEPVNEVELVDNWLHAALNVTE